MNVIEESIYTAAKKDLWANVRGDTQIYIKPHLLTGRIGVTNSIKLPFNFYVTPEANKAFALYESGPLPSRSLGIQNNNLVNWVKLSDIVTNEKLFVIPTIEGRVLPLSAIWIKEERHNLIYAIDMPATKKFYEGNDGGLWIRFYSNSWYASGDSDTVSQHFDIFSGIVGVDVTGSQVMTYVAGCPPEVPYQLIYKNGELVDNPNSPVITDGDSFLIIRDPSIYRKVSIPVADMPRFFSELDEERRKLIAVTPKDDASSFHWKDDIEVHLTDVDPAANITTRRGLILDRRQDRTIRQLTAVDYSLDVVDIETLINNNLFLGSETTEVEILFRKTTRNGFLTQNNHFTQDLFMLSDEEREYHLRDGNDALDFWTARSIEQSGHMRFAFSTDQTGFDLSNVFNLYGLRHYTQDAINIGDGRFTIPPTMKWGGILLEYDVNGLLVRHTVWHDGIYRPSYTTSSDVTAIKLVPGLRYTSDDQLNIPSELTNDTVSEWYEERFYRTGVSGKWTLAVEGNEFVLNEDGLVDWDFKFGSLVRVKRRANGYAMISGTVTDAEIGKKLSLFDAITDADDELGFGRYEAFLNGRSLTEGVDFIVNYPYVFITCQQYIKPGLDNDFLVIGHGCPGEYTPPTPLFVEHRKIATDNFDLVLFRDFDFVVDGRRINEEDVVLSNGYAHPENTLTEVPVGFREGSLCSINKRTTKMGITDLIAFDESVMETAEKDSKIKDLFTPTYVSPENDDPVFINEKHGVISVLLYTLLDDILTGKLIIGQGGLSDLAVNIKLNPYRELIDLDICKQPIPLTYIEIAAHGGEDPIVLTPWQLDFLAKVNRLWLDDRCVLTKYFRI